METTRGLMALEHGTGFSTGNTAALQPPVGSKVGNASSHTYAAIEDRRITRSKRALRNALIDLMEERGYETLTVNDLCSRADLNRGTFYNHFHDKEDLMVTLENEVLENLRGFETMMGDLTVVDLLKYKVSQRPFPFLVAFFDYLREEADFLHAALGPGGDVRFGFRLRDSICSEMIQSILHERYREDPTVFVNYYVSFYASAYLGVIMRWLDTGMEESSSDMALITTRLLFIQPGEPIEL